MLKVHFKRKSDKIDDENDKSLALRIGKFILPLLMSGILQLLYNAADSIVVGNHDGPNALAAVTSVGALINLLLNIFIGMSVGTAVCVAHDVGAKDEEGVHRDIHTSILLGLISGVVVGIIGFIFSGTFLQWMDSPEDVIGQSELYMKIYFIGTPANIIYNFGASIMRSLGETKRPLYYLTFAGILNVILNIILVVGFNLGVAGVAVGTIVSQFVAAACIIADLIKRKDGAHFDFRKMRIYKEKLKKIVVVGLPAGLQGIAFSLSNVLIQSSVNSFGQYAMAGNGAAASIEGFTYIAMNSVYHASLTFVGQSVGAKKYNRIGRIVATCLVFVVIIGIVLGYVSYFFGNQLLSLYIDSNSEGVDIAVSYGLLRMRYILLTYFIFGVMDVMVGAQRGMGMSFIPMANALIGTCLLRIVWISVVFPIFNTLDSVYISYPISWVITLIAHSICYFIKLNKLKKEHATEGDLIPEQQ